FKDQDTKEHIFNLEGSLLFEKPRRLRIDLRPGVGDQAMQLGSNDRDFWYWVEPELHRMRWGRHSSVGKPCLKDIAIRPDQGAAALGFSGLPGPSEGLGVPRLIKGKTYDRLVYKRSGGGQGGQLDREYWVERVPPYLVRVVLFRDGSG